MTDILAYDIDGRPLRAGDRVVILQSKYRPDRIGAVVTIIGPDNDGFDDFDVDIPHPGKFQWYSGRGYQVRRINTDHTPAETGFTELVEKLKNGSLEPLEIE